MKVIKLSRNVQIPISRHSGVNESKILHRDWEYVVLDKAVNLLSSEYENDLTVSDITPTWPTDIWKPSGILTIICPGGIGDMLVLRYVIHEFKCRYPGMRVCVAAAPGDDFWLSDYADGVITYPPLYNTVRSTDYVVSMEDEVRQSQNQNAYEVFARVLGMQLDNVNIREVMPLAVSSAIRDMVKNALPRSGRKKIGIQVASAAHYRSYPRHLTALLALELSTKFDVYIVGSIMQEIRWIKDGVEVAPPDHVYDLCGKFDTNEEFFAVVDMMDALITPDSSVLHIGAWLNKPTIGLFSITRGDTTTKYYPTVRYIQGQADCAPCLKIAEIPDCGERFCKAMLAINAFEVADMVANML